jgi:glycosyltransferase involved in cell wall biosynthesis
MPKISALICCANSAATLPAACRSVQWADELVIVDSGSTDGTEKIARQFADRYVLEDWRGYTEQKKYGTTLCENNWIFSLDGDEECSQELAAEIRRLSKHEFDRRDVFFVKRRNFVMGRHVRAWDPDWQSRLIHCHRCRWADADLHDARLPSHPDRGRKLHGWLYHKRAGDAEFSDYFSGDRGDRRFWLLAAEMHRKGRRCKWHDLVIRPAWAFLRFYVIKQSFRDGAFGLLIAYKAAFGVLIKYAALWAFQQGMSSGVRATAHLRADRLPIAHDETKSAA